MVGAGGLEPRPSRCVGGCSLLLPHGGALLGALHNTPVTCSAPSPKRRESTEQPQVDSPNAPGGDATFLGRPRRLMGWPSLLRNR